MFLHFLTFAAYFLPRINFDALNNATNVTKIDESRNISYPFYNMDQDSNMSKAFRLPRKYTVNALHSKHVFAFKLQKK